MHVLITGTVDIVFVALNMQNYVVVVLQSDVLC